MSLCALTPEIKAEIDELTPAELAHHWRFAPLGDPWLVGETGDYFIERFKSSGAAACTIATGWGWRGEIE